MELVTKPIITKNSKKKQSYSARLKRDLRKNKVVYFMVLPVIAYYIIFHYLPMYGVIIAFMDYDPWLGVLGSPWVGLQNFQDFFSSMYFFRVLRNTFVISATNILFGFPAPIILALLINEISRKRFAKVVQTATYIPHFISLVVVCGMTVSFTGANGIVTNVVSMFTNHDSSMSLLMKPQYFLPIHVATELWQKVGWDSIIYMAALAGIDQQLYEACEIDGGGYLRKMWHITLPSLMPTIVILFILKLGGILSVGQEKILLLYNPRIYETSDVISSFVFREGLQATNWSFGAAVGLFNSVINIIFLLGANYLSKKFTESSLW